MSIETITFQGQGGQLVLEVSGYERPEAQDAYDANWLKAIVSIKAGAFAGKFKAAFGTYDLAELQRQFDEMLEKLSGTANFEGPEGDLSFAVELDARGGAVVSGTAKPSASDEAAFSFRFETDQSFLSQTAQELSSVVERFPIRQPLQPSSA